MIIAPIQLQQLSFRRVSVEIDANHPGKDEFDKTDRNSDFDGVLIGTHVGLSPITPDTNDSALIFLVTLRVTIDNEKPNDDKGWKPSDYLIGIEAGAIIRVLEGAEKLGDIEDLVVVNGTSILWSAIREQVCNLTARMPLGMATLPTVNFHDLRKQEPEVAPAQPSKPRVGKARSKTPA